MSWQKATSGSIFDKKNVLDSVLDLDPVVKPGQKIRALNSFRPIPYLGKYWFEKEFEISY